MPRPKRRLFIIGTDGAAREILWTATQVPLDDRDWEPAGFLADDVDGARGELARRGIALPVVGAVADYAPASDDVFTCAIVDPRAKLEAAEIVRARGGAFVPVIHPTALVHETAVVGTGVIMRHYSGIGPNTVVGDFVTICQSAGPSHDNVVGDGCTIAPHADVMGNARLGRGVLLGNHGVVLPGATVGDFAVVGAGSVVLRRVPPGATVFGVPARRLDFVPVREEVAR